MREGEKSFTVGLQLWLVLRHSLMDLVTKIFSQSMNYTAQTMPFGFGLTGMRTTRKGRGVSLSPHFGRKLVRGPNRGGAVAEGWRAWVMGEFGF